MTAIKPLKNPLPKPYSYCKEHFKLHPECIPCVRGCLTEEQQAALIDYATMVDKRANFKMLAVQAKERGDTKVSKKMWAMYYDVDRKLELARDRLIKSFMAWLPDDVVYGR